MLRTGWGFVGATVLVLAACEAGSAPVGDALVEMGREMQGDAGAQDMVEAPDGSSGEPSDDDTTDGSSGEAPPEVTWVEAGCDTAFGSRSEYTGYGEETAQRYATFQVEGLGAQADVWAVLCDYEETVDHRPICRGSSCVPYAAGSLPPTLSCRTTREIMFDGRQALVACGATRIVIDEGRDITAEDWRYRTVRLAIRRP